MSYNINGTNVTTYLQPYVAGNITSATTTGFRINGNDLKLIFAGRDNKTSNAVTVISNSGLKVSGTDILSLFNKINATFDIAISGSATYDGTAKTPSISAVSPTNVPGSLVISSLTNAATYTPSQFTITLPGNYLLGTTSGTFVINPRTITLTSGVISFTYDGSTKTATFTINNTVGVDGGYSVTSASAVNAGSYTASLVSSSSNYTVGSPSSFVWTIGQASITITFSGNGTYTYDGSAKTISWSVSPNVAVTNTTPTSLTNAGSITVTVSSNNSNYAGSNSASLTIGKRPLSLSSVGGTSLTYNGSSQTIGYQVNNAVGADSGYSVSNASATNVGSYTAALNVSSANYSVGSPSSFLWSIVQAPITITFSGNGSYTYDGNAKTISWSVSPSVAVTNTTPTSITNVGSITVTVSSNNSNYAGSNSASISIGKRTISLSSVGATTFTYNGAYQSVGYSVDNAVGADGGYSVSGQTAINAGSYTTSLSITSGNYQAGTSSFGWTISPQLLSFDARWFDRDYGSTYIHFKYYASYAQSHLSNCNPGETVVAYVASYATPYLVASSQNYIPNIVHLPSFNGYYDIGSGEITVQGLSADSNYAYSGSITLTYNWTYYPDNGGGPIELYPQP